MSLLFFFFKQKTAYEMRISDWSSDVCSSDLLAQHRLTALRGLAHFGTKFANDPRTLCLRRVKREVCALQYSFGVIAVGRPHGGARANADGQDALVDGERIGHAL